MHNKLSQFVPGWLDWWCIQNEIEFSAKSKLWIYSIKNAFPFLATPDTPNENTDIFSNALKTIWRACRHFGGAKASSEKSDKWFVVAHENVAKALTTYQHYKLRNLLFRYFQTIKRRVWALWNVVHNSTMLNSFVCLVQKFTRFNYLRIHTHIFHTTTSYTQHTYSVHTMVMTDEYPALFFV